MPDQKVATTPEEDDALVNTGLYDDLDALMREAALAGWSLNEFTQAVFEQSVLIAWGADDDDD